MPTIPNTREAAARIRAIREEARALNDIRWPPLKGFDAQWRAYRNRINRISCNRFAANKAEKLLMAIIDELKESSDADV